MAFIDSAPGTVLPVFYNLVHAVGENCPNVRDDVKLVQYLLMAFYGKAVQNGVSKPHGDIAVTGFCGPATMNWILKFQLDYSKSNPGDIRVDKRIDRIRQKNFLGSITKTHYTLAILNSYVQTLNPEAFIALPGLIQLDNPMNVPPPSWDVVNRSEVPVTGGI